MIVLNNGCCRGQRDEHLKRVTVLAHHPRNGSERALHKKKRRREGEEREMVAGSTTWSQRERGRTVRVS